MIRPRFLALMLALCALSACGGGGDEGGPGGECENCSGVSGASSNTGSGTSTTTSPTLAANQATLTVGPGPTGASDANIPYVTVTVCQPTTGTCAAIDDVLVDTGSYGFRVLASALSSAGLSLPASPDPNNSGNTIAECGPFADGYTWGPLSEATIEIGGETATKIPVNVLDDTNSYAPNVPSACTALTANQSLSSVKDLHANAILGVGFAPYDCGEVCAKCASFTGGCSSANTIYYSCDATGTCNPTQVAVSAQVRNPVTSFATDNNGVILQLPAIASAGVPSAVGSITFGIGTQSNNGLGSASVLVLSGSGTFSTTFQGQTLANSFIDSGSNGFYFPDKSIATCSQNAGFYCPASTLTLTAVNQGQNGDSNTVDIQIADASTLSTSNYAFADIGGPAPTPSGGGTDLLEGSFDFGLPFFYGRSVFVLFDGATSGGITGPANAY
jgi:hypothetical protein